MWPDRCQRREGRKLKQQERPKELSSDWLVCFEVIRAAAQAGGGVSTNVPAIRGML